MKYTAVVKTLPRCAQSLLQNYQLLRFRSCVPT